MNLYSWLLCVVLAVLSVQLMVAVPITDRYGARRRNRQRESRRNRNKHYNRNSLIEGRRRGKTTTSTTTTTTTTTTPPSSTTATTTTRAPPLPPMIRPELPAATLGQMIFRRKTRESQSNTHKKLDVPQIECPPAEDGIMQFACPTPDKLGRYHCIDDHVLCDGIYHCPGREDEDTTICMFFKMTLSYFKVFTDAIYSWNP